MPYQLWISDFTYVSSWQVMVYAAFVIHDLRHTFALLLVSRGASLEMVAKLLGHAQVQTTQRYAHLADAPLRGRVDAVAEMLRPRPKLVSTRQP